MSTTGANVAAIATGAFVPVAAVESPLLVASAPAPRVDEAMAAVNEPAANVQAKPVPAGVAQPAAGGANQPAKTAVATSPPPNPDAGADDTGADASATATAPATDAAPTAASVLAKPATQHHTTVAQPARPQAFGKQAEGPGIGGAVFALILVVSLILGLCWLARRMPGFGRVAGGNALRVVASLALGPRERVVVVEVGGTQLLLGVGQGGMRHLHTLAEPLPTAQVSQGNPGLQNLATPFAQLLQKHLGKKP